MTNAEPWHATIEQLVDKAMEFVRSQVPNEIDNAISHKLRQELNGICDRELGRLMRERSEPTNTD